MFVFEQEILKVYKFCGIKSFPVDCSQIAESIRYQVKTYQDVAETKEQYIEMMKVSGDAYVIRAHKTIYINDKIVERRKRFSLAHELGHVIMLNEDEDIADTFASNLLAPRPMVFAEKLQTADEIAKYFDISISAANNVIFDMRRPNRKKYFPDIDGLNMIDYFGLRWKYSSLYPYDGSPLESPKITTTLIDTMMSEAKKKERYQKQVRSLKSKIQRARLRMMEATDEATYYKYERKIRENEKHLALIQGMDPFDTEDAMDDFNNSVIFREPY